MNNLKIYKSFLNTQIKKYDFYHVYNWLKNKNAENADKQRIFAKNRITLIRWYKYTYLKR